MRRIGDPTLFVVLCGIFRGISDCSTRLCSAENVRRNFSLCASNVFATSGALDLLALLPNQASAFKMLTDRYVLIQVLLAAQRACMRIMRRMFMTISLEIMSRRVVGRDDYEVTAFLIGEAMERAN